ncbi:MAG TPA: hypothetical protein VGR85_13100 [Candidatus Limnocylindria bacterium]|jgi:hypothetical protein|nr:hypothetical protein [Candidatus Limnocylindria bacterium]
MTQRDIVIVLGTLVVAVGLSAILFVGAAATSPASGPEPSARPRVFFDPRNSLPPGRTIIDAQRRVAGPLQVIVPLQRGVSDTARDAAGLLLTLLLTASTLVLANDQVVAVYRASLGGWRSQARVFAAGFVVMGLAISTAALAWVVFLSFVAGALRDTPFGAPVALQVGLTAFAVVCVFALLALLVGFAATAWRLGDALLRTRALSRFQTQLPAPVVALAGATILFVLWQIPALGAVALAAVVAYALGAVVTARLIKEGVST